MPSTKTHNRVNDTITGPLERPVLAWLSAQMPHWINPDILTGIGVFGSILIFFSYLLTHIDKFFLWGASLGFFLNWFGDSLDGTLARYRHIERPKYGFFIDHIVDAFSQVLIILGIGLSPYMKFEMASLTLIGYLLMSVYVYVDTYVSGIFKISYAKLGPTELRLIAILINTVIFFFGNPSVTIQTVNLTMLDLVGAFIAAAFLIVFIAYSLRRAIELAELGG